jgi:hypothetical protein
MNRTGPIKIKTDKKSVVNLLLMTTLPLLAVAIAFLLGRSSEKTGFVVMAGILGAGCVIVAIARPIFGFYFTILLSFFFADIGRLLKTDLPLGTVIDIFVFLTFLGILLKKLTSGEAFWKHCKSPIMYAYGGIILYSLIEIFNPNAISRDTSLLILRRFFAIQVFLYCSLQLFTDVASIRRFFKLWVVLALIGALYACYQEWAGYPHYEMDYILSDVHLTDLYSLDNGNYRKFSFLADPTSFGILMSACALLNLIFILTLDINQTKKLILGVSMLIILMAIGYSGTRTAYGSFVIGIAVYILMTLSNFRTMIFACFSAVIFIGLIFGPFLRSNATLNRIRTTFHPSKDASLQVRDINRKRIQPYLRSHPLGGGLGSTGTGTTSATGGGAKAASSSSPLAGFPTDSGFLRMALEYGWIGLIIQCIIFFIVLQQGIRAYFRSRDPVNRSLLLASVVCLFSYIMAHYAQVAIGPLPGAFLFYPLIAIIIRLRQMELSTYVS